MSCTFTQKYRKPQQVHALTINFNSFIITTKFLNILSDQIFELIEFPGETWRGKWQGNEIAAKILSIRECTPRISRDFNEEYPKLR